MAPHRCPNYFRIVPSTQPWAFLWFARRSAWFPECWNLLFDQGTGGGLKMQGLTKFSLPFINRVCRTIIIAVNIGLHICVERTTYWCNKNHNSFVFL